MSNLPPPPPGEMPRDLPEPEGIRENYLPSAEELRTGFVLHPDETVVFDITPNPTDAIRTYGIPGEVEVTGRAVAEVRIGGEKEYTTVLVINTFDSDARKDFSLFLPTRNKPVILPLKKDELWGLGRGFENQSELPDTVSRDHCAVGLDEHGQLVVENHNPTNQTSIRRLGKF